MQKESSTTRSRRGFLRTGGVVVAAAAAPMALLAAATRRSLGDNTAVDVDTDRYRRGLQVLRQVGGADYDRPISNLSQVAPDLARFTVEFAYGDLMARPGLDLKARELCTVAALTALANAQPQLQYHINGALNVGWSQTDVIEVIILATVYAGFPAALNGITAAREVFKRRGGPESAAPTSGEPGDERYQRGRRAIERVSGDAGLAVVESLNDVAPDLGRFVVEFSYGDVITRPALDDKIKELATVALLTALGTAQPQLKVHVQAALNVGNSRDEIVQAIEQMAVYAGFPAALNGITAARKVFDEQPR
jgi:4-carboxymuconolactone decarboxylase